MSFLDFPDMASKDLNLSIIAIAEKIEKMIKYIKFHLGCLS